MFLIPNSFDALFTVTPPVDARGALAKIDGVPQWSVSDPTMASVEPSEDGLSVKVITIGPAGAFQLNVTADADLGDGVKPITGILDIEIVAGEAVSIGIAAGELVPKIV